MPVACVDFVYTDGAPRGGVGEAKLSGNVLVGREVGDAHEEFALCGGQSGHYVQHWERPHVGHPVRATFSYQVIRHLVVIAIDLYFQQLVAQVVSEKSDMATLRTVRNRVTTKPSIGKGISAISIFAPLLVMARHLVPHQVLNDRRI
jgi:hypothetical protein